MTTIAIGPIDLAKIRAHGEEAYPHECCGFLLGEHSDDARTVRAAIRAANEREEPNRRNRFLITPEAYREADKKARKRGLDIIGFYHSHPDVEVRPSEYDREHGWPWYSYVIVSVREGRAGDATSWRLKDDRSGFDAEEVVVNETAKA